MTKHYASQGAVNQNGGSLPVSTCKRCGNEVVWVTSKRTGKRYLVNVSIGYRDQRFYMGHNIHRCDEILAAREQAAAEEQRRGDLLAEVAEQQRAYKAGEITRDQYLVWIDKLANYS